MAIKEAVALFSQSELGALESRRDMQQFFSDNPHEWEAILEGMGEIDPRRAVLKDFRITNTTNDANGFRVEVVIVVDTDPNVKHTITAEFDLLAGNHDGYLEDWFRAWFNEYQVDPWKLVVDEYCDSEPESIKSNRDWVAEQFSFWRGGKEEVWDKAYNFLRDLHSKHELSVEVDWSIDRNGVNVVMSFEWEQPIPQPEVKDD